MHHNPLQEKSHGVVSVSVADVHARPAFTSVVTTQALLGTPVKVLKQKAGWLLVQLPDGYEGWVCDTICPMSAREFARWTSADKIIATADHCVCRQSPDEVSAPVSDVVAGGILAVTGAKGRFYRVACPDGRTGFLPKRCAQPLRQWIARALPTPRRIVATAERFKGVPYSWGGTSAKAFDCSGFVKTVYFLCGTLLPRDASQQYRAGHAVSRPAPGDLLFFGTRRGRSKRIIHVGISLGGSRFFEASGCVRESSLDPADADFCTKRALTYLGARRIFGAHGKSGARLLRSIPYYRNA
jgi:SH3-like domain-containing protein